MTKKTAAASTTSVSPQIATRMGELRRSARRAAPLL